MPGTLLASSTSVTKAQYGEDQAEKCEIMWNFETR